VLLSLQVLKGGRAGSRSRRRVLAVAPLGLRVGAVVSGDTLLVGDAAGAPDPVTGEGMSLAILSARAAAEAIVSGRPADYEARGGSWPRAPTGSAAGCCGPRGIRRSPTGLSARWSSTPSSSRNFSDFRRPEAGGGPESRRRGPPGGLMQTRSLEPELLDHEVPPVGERAGSSATSPSSIAGWAGPPRRRSTLVRSKGRRSWLDVARGRRT